MKAKEIEIVFVGGPGAASNKGTITRRIALRISGEDRDVVTVRLDSDVSRRRQAKRWAQTYGLDETTLTAKLTKAALVAAAEAQTPRADSAPGGGTESPPCTPHTLDEARPVFSKWLHDTDPALLDVVFGAILAHRLDGDPVWMFIVGAPGDGKTEALRSFSTHLRIYSVSTLTPGTLISGYITDGPDPSLLPKLDGRVLVIKDFTAILEMPNESRQEMLGLLRDAYDGEACKAFGTGDVKRYRSRFGLLAAVTPIVDKYWGVNAQLGERFLRFRLPTRGRRNKVRRALANTNDEKAMRRELSAAAHGVLAQQPEWIPVVPGNIEDRLIALADFVSLARSEVARDRQGVMQSVPAPEVGTRCGKALKKLAIGIAIANGRECVGESEYAIVCRVGRDTIPSMRARLLGVLWDRRGSFGSTAEVADAAEVPTDTAKVWMDDLRVLGMVERGGDQHSGYTWRLKGSFCETILRAGLFSNDDECPTGGDSAPLTPNCPDPVRGTESAPPPLSDDESDRRGARSDPS